MLIPHFESLPLAIPNIKPDWNILRTFWERFSVCFWHIRKDDLRSKKIMKKGHKVKWKFFILRTRKMLMKALGVPWKHAESTKEWFGNHFPNLTDTLQDLWRNISILMSDLVEWRMAAGAPGVTIQHLSGTSHSICPAKVALLLVLSIHPLFSPSFIV